MTSAEKSNDRVHWLQKLAWFGSGIAAPIALVMLIPQFTKLMNENRTLERQQQEADKREAALWFGLDEFSGPWRTDDSDKSLDRDHTSVFLILEGSLYKIVGNKPLKALYASDNYGIGTQRAGLQNMPTGVPFELDADCNLYYRLVTPPAKASQVKEYYLLNGKKEIKLSTKHLAQLRFVGLDKVNLRP